MDNNESSLFHKKFTLTVPYWMGFLWVLLTLLALTGVLLARAGKVVETKDTVVTNDVSAMSEMSAIDPTYTFEKESMTLNYSQFQQCLAVESQGRVTVLGKPVYGDVNGDGASDEVVILTRSVGTSTNYFIAASMKVSGTLICTNAVLLPGKVSQENISVQNGIITAMVPSFSPVTGQMTLEDPRQFQLEGFELKPLNKIFSSEKYGISFQYPPDWNITVAHEMKLERFSDLEVTVTKSDSEKVDILISDRNPQSLSIGGWLNSHGDNVSIIPYGIIGGTEAVTEVNGSGQILFTHGKMVVWITLTGSILDEFAIIKKSFTFTTPENYKTESVEPIKVPSAKESEPNREMGGWVLP